MRIHDAHAHFVGTPATDAQASCETCDWIGPLHNNFADRPIDRWNRATRDRDTHNDTAHREVVGAPD